MRHFISAIVRDAVTSRLRKEQASSVRGHVEVSYGVKSWNHERGVAARIRATCRFLPAGLRHDGVTRRDGVE